MITCFSYIPSSINWFSTTHMNCTCVFCVNFRLLLKSIPFCQLVIVLCISDFVKTSKRGILNLHSGISIEGCVLIRCDWRWSEKESYGFVGESDRLCSCNQFASIARLLNFTNDLCQRLMYFMIVVIVYLYYNSNFLCVIAFLVKDLFTLPIPKSCIAWFNIFWHFFLFYLLTFSTTE
jgi:hypothetical protein